MRIREIFLHNAHIFRLLALLLAFAVALGELDQDGFWNDEVWSVWASLASLSETIRRVAADVHPPLYFVALNGWMKLVGESIYAVRFLSVIFGMLGLALTYRLATEWFDRSTGSMALLLLGTSGFFVYYMREARMYTLLLCLAVLSMWAYRRLLYQPTFAHLLIYGVTIAALPYTHYVGLLITLSQALHLLLTHKINKQAFRLWPFAALFALLLFTPWLFVFLQQLLIHPNGPLARPLATNWSQVIWLLTVLSGGIGLWLLAPFVLGKALLRWREYGNQLLLLLLWLLLTPLIILSLNAWLAPLYQVRYMIAILPTVALLTAYGLRHLFWQPLGVPILLCFVSMQLMAYPHFWPPKAPKGIERAKLAMAARQPDEPSLVMIVQPSSLEAYYDRHLGFRNEAALDLSAQRYSYAELEQIVASLEKEASVWVIMPSNIGETWLVTALLDKDRHIGYRDHAAHLLFYRFDQGNKDNLQFYFGDKLRLESSLLPSLPPLQPSDPFCLEVSLKTLTRLDNRYSYGLHLVNRDNVLLAQHDEGLGARSANETIQLKPCLKIPPDLPPDEYQLHLVVYNWADGQRLPLHEKDQTALYWGDALVLGKAELRE
ncbi:MAG: glycosyltransferase family 39 protein [Ardenticatenaceae bacterium]